VNYVCVICSTPVKKENNFCCEKCGKIKVVSAIVQPHEDRIHGFRGLHYFEWQSLYDMVGVN
jgi:hypothetical protein